jgi:hypothetical protein
LGGTKKEKPPGLPAVSGGVRVVSFDYAFASPAAKRCENQKYVKKNIETPELMDGNVARRADLAIARIQ